MPASFNGIGTAYSGFRAPIFWTAPRFGLFRSESRPDHDAIEAFVVLFIPVVPLRAFHTFEWSGEHCRVVPIRMTRALIARAYLRTALLVPAGISFTAAIVAIIASFATLSPVVIAWTGGFIAAFAVFLGALRGLDRCDRRTRDIRLVLGPHELGSSDPALWPPDVVEKTVSPDLAQAGDALARADFPHAMAMARLAVARGMPDGERLTGDILGDPRIAAILPALRKAPWKRGELLAAAEIAPGIPAPIG